MEKISLETGQGLDLQLTVAGVGARSYAFIIDWHIRFVLAFAWFLGFVLLSDIGSDWWQAIADMFEADTNFSGLLLLMLIPPLIIYFLYHPLLEIVMNGQTPGKRITGVRIVRRNGMPAGIAQYLIRNVFRLIDSLPAFYCFGLLSCFIHSQQLRIGDMAAGTVLVYVDHDTRNDMAELQSAIGDSKLSLQQSQFLHELLQRWHKLDKLKRRTLACEFLREVGLSPMDFDQYSDKQLFKLLAQQAQQ